MVYDYEVESSIYGMDRTKSYQKSKNLASDFMDGGGDFPYLLFFLSLSFLLRVV